MMLLAILLLILLLTKQYSIALILILVSVVGYIILEKIKREKERKELRRQIELEIQREREEHNIWLQQREQLHRNDRGYPIDWDFRVKEIYQRAGGKCSSCGKHLTLGKGTHTHHKKPIRQGGAHSLNNLSLLCEECHIRIHPQLGKLLHSKKSAM